MKEWNGHPHIFGINQSYNYIRVIKEISFHIIEIFFPEFLESLL